MGRPRTLHSPRRAALREWTSARNLAGRELAARHRAEEKGGRFFREHTPSFRGPSLRNPKRVLPSARPRSLPTPVAASPLAGNAELPVVDLITIRLSKRGPCRRGYTLSTVPRRSRDGPCCDLHEPPARFLQSSLINSNYARMSDVRASGHETPRVFRDVIAPGLEKLSAPGASTRFLGPSNFYEGSANVLGPSVRSRSTVLLRASFIPVFGALLIRG